MKNNSFVKTDGGRIEAGFTTERNDCLVRAFAVASDIPYHESHDLFQKLGRVSGSGLTWNEIEGAFIARGLKPHTLLFRVSLTTFIAHHPTGNFFVAKRGHAFAVKNGVVFDDNRIGGNTSIKHFIEIPPKVGV